MNSTLKFTLLGLGLGAAAFWVARNKGAQSYLIEAGDVVQDVASELTGGFFMKVSNMRTVTANDVNNANVQAFLRVIRAGEGTSDANGYRRIFGGQLFLSFADHPRVIVKKNGYTSSAAGAYQFLISSWDETKRIMGLPDFSPGSQDLAAVGRIAARGALDDVKAGRFDIAIKKIGREWASMPGSPYGQPTISLAKARQIFTASGGAIINTGVMTA